MNEILRATRWSSADWATETKEILVVGMGGIGSWLSLSLSRIGHSLILMDEDVVDESNVQGGQLYRTKDIGTKKADTVYSICREFGCISELTSMPFMYEKGSIPYPITLTGLDNMKARRDVFEDWLNVENKSLLMDGRLLLETAEILCIQADKPEQIEEYREKWLFDDADIPEAECTAKQSTFAAMTIAGMMTGLLCNFLTNKKLGMEFRECPFYQRLYFPSFAYKTEEIAKFEIHGTEAC